MAECRVQIAVCSVRFGNSLGILRVICAQAGVSVRGAKSAAAFLGFYMQRLPAPVNPKRVKI